jgi:hypothetical protein
VSLQALLVRARRLGTISERAYANAFRYLSRQGWRRNEPVDLGPPEEPQLLPRAFALIARKGITPSDLFETLALPEMCTSELAAPEVEMSPRGEVLPFGRRTFASAPAFSGPS